ncbi:Bcr/CflA family multidrug efflux MFS transporter [Heyndrickxia oleronia]|jgi:DHA1 family bicyclomycin/chloramphenicol resistance-like MFS transporter|uniref:Bcr/CflA family multidrug efflux MFS transporter n=2 Tax=Bacillaceae TaxID=186817 RepID=UPI001C0F13FD|nr:Bcr/CflA family multidrug efflux MFS transporter [Heyndrickxia oleronia]MBU5213192.1 Bcr/CflA family multidrug efflux MFS transporter [Heyndrickxia oleronia]MCI1591987.1 Bcr/CflA family multidrug efflux MFS transporter [Heyndrickxia oleronia]MCI1613929.1 Bcr/CflA family multidrug efflux MFS transporter [Heyndrickxia oleronia]MCI1745164.1 Bcr/CflA family multidrug efflux MFS transporter [Heyndrickxia oleronia]MCI1760901.1 Bcr/CflA family multidrug efflux MFS transporter [Heyndrickxia oleroni
MNMEKELIHSPSMAKSRRLWIAFVLGALSAFGPLSIDMYLPALPKLTEELHTNTSVAQLSLTACLIGLALGQLLVGPLSDVRGRKKPLLIALILYSVASILCAYSTSIWMLIFLRFIQGATGAAGIVISRASVRDMYSGTELTKFFALLMLVNGAAPILAPIAGGQLLHFVTWRGVFFVLFVIGILMWLAVSFGLKETLPRERRSPGGLKQTFSTFHLIITDRQFMGYAFSQGLVSAAMFGYISGSPFVLQDIFGVSPQMFSVIFAINGVGIIIASQLTGRLAGRVSELKLFIIGISLCAIGGVILLLVVLLDAGLYAVIPSLFIVVSSVGMVGTTSFSLAMQNQSETAGSASAILGLLPFILGAIVAPLVGLGGSHTAVPMAIVIAGCGIGAVLVYLFLNNKK